VVVGGLAPPPTPPTPKPPIPNPQSPIYIVQYVEIINKIY